MFSVHYRVQFVRHESGVVCVYMCTVCTACLNCAVKMYRCWHRMLLCPVQSYGELQQKSAHSGRWIKTPETSDFIDNELFFSGGVSGLFAALRLAENGVKNIEILEVRKHVLLRCDSCVMNGMCTHVLCPEGSWQAGWESEQCQAWGGGHWVGCSVDPWQGGVPSLEICQRQSNTR